MPTFLNGYKTILVSLAFLAYAVLGYFLHQLDIVQALVIVQIALSALGLHSQKTNATTTTVSTSVVQVPAITTTTTPAIVPTPSNISPSGVNGGGV